MTEAIMKYTFAPLSGFWSSLNKTMHIIGYSRAAAELARQGYYDESKKLMLEVSKLKDK